MINLLKSLVSNKRSFITICSLFFATPVINAGSQFYGATLEQAKWRTSGNRLECRLSQDIPGYGKAMFKHRALNSIEFRVSSDYQPREPSQALLYANPPVWKRYANSTMLGRIPINVNEDIIVVPEDYAIRMSLELREGMEAVWTHADFADGKDIVTAKVLPILFEDAWRDFQQCGTNLIDYSYDDVRSSIFYFSKKGMSLGADEKAYLNKLAEYISLDSQYQHIRISSYTDSRGVRRLNLATSKRRANMVKDYLIKKGVNEKNFVIVATGEKNPKYNNRTASGRAKNRRVEVNLIK